MMHARRASCVRAHQHECGMADVQSSLTTRAPARPLAGGSQPARLRPKSLLRCRRVRCVPQARGAPAGNGAAGGLFRGDHRPLSGAAGREAGVSRERAAPLQSSTM